MLNILWACLLEIIHILLQFIPMELGLVELPHPIPLNIITSTLSSFSGGLVI